MKTLNRISWILPALLIVLSACGKKNTDPTPTHGPTGATISGTYRIVKDQGSDNGDTVYYTRTIGFCESGERFTFDGTTLTVSNPCSPPQTATWTYNAELSKLTLTISGRIITIKVEDITTNGFIWDAIATGEDNDRYTLVRATPLGKPDSAYLTGTWILNRSQIPGPSGWADVDGQGPIGYVTMTVNPNHVLSFADNNVTTTTGTWKVSGNVEFFTEHYGNTTVADTIATLDADTLRLLNPTPVWVYNTVYPYSRDTYLKKQ